MWWMWLLQVSSAQGIDLEAWVELGTVTRTGAGSGDDMATDVAIDQTGHVIAVGALDGAAGHGTNGYLVVLENYNMAFLWDLEVDAGAVSDTLPDSNDRIEAIANPGSNDLAFCGRMGSPTIGDAPDGGYWVHATEPHADGIHYEPTESWSWTLQDGKGSANQSCSDLERAGQRLFAAGFSENAAEGGRWVSYRTSALDGTGEPAFTTSDGIGGAQERAHGISGGRTSGAFAVVGSVATAQGDSDWHVRFYDAAGALVWTDQIDGAAHGDDAARAVVYDEAEGTVTVAGYAVDDTTSMERDWLVVQYDAAGAGGGAPAVRWRAVAGAGSGAHDTATSVALDELGTVVVGGGLYVAGSERWHVATFDSKDGTAGTTWTGPAHAGDARIEGMHLRGQQLAMAGYTHDGTKREFTVSLREPDADGDGVSDSADECPDDANKSETGICGCGLSDTADRDADKTPDCVDRCPDDASKATSEGVCGCGVPDVDTDVDGVFDCFDECPDDGDKLEPGLCGCNVSDEDEDGDGVVDCADACLGSGVGVTVDASGCADEERAEGCGCQHPTGATWPALVLWLGVVARRRRLRGNSPWQ